MVNVTHDTATGWPEWFVSAEKVLDVTVNWGQIPDETRPKIETLISLILTVVCALVDHEEEVRLQVNGNPRRAMFTVRVNSDDVAFALGGRRHCEKCNVETKAAHASALRTLLIATCRKLHFHFDMDIIGPSGTSDWSSDD